MSQDHVTSVLCKLTFSQESGVALQATVETLLRDSANAKYQYSYLFFYERNKGDLPLIPARGWGGGGGGTWVNVWVCAAGLSEPLPHSLSFGQL